MRTFFNDKYHFNPHSRKGSDLEHKEQIQASRNFNPHSRKGSDRNRQANIWGREISIHTPARGVTIAKVKEDLLAQFQSTLPQGEWRL